MKEREYQLLQAISEDETATQAGLAALLGMAVGSVNWYIKRLISRGYLKATRMDRTRLRYNLTAEGMTVFRRNATQYVKDSLKIYHRLRNEAKSVVALLQEQGVERVSLKGEETQLDIFRLTCLEAGIHVVDSVAEWTVETDGDGYQLQQLTEEMDQAL